MPTTTPVIAGFYPDPSVCRVGDTYYLVNSSFEYLPGLPIHTSADLKTWTFVGNALTRTTQIAEHAGDPSGGIFAPTIRHHAGKFWIVGTNFNDVMLGRGQFIITADDPAGPWSDPVWVDAAVGIDPDLVWDDDGVCHLTWAAFTPEIQGIASAPVDVVRGSLLAPPRLLWQGTGGAHAEGPHLYRKDGWWYLLLAEGGTERGHMTTIARARTLEGPFETAPNNPILSHRSTSEPVQNVGHADLIQLADGSWAAVHLGVRPHGRTPSFHVLGRETFVIGIDWRDEWPVAAEGRFLVSPTDHSFVDDFSAGQLDPRWLGVGRFPTNFSRPSAQGLVLSASAAPDRKAVLAARVRDLQWRAEARMRVAEGEAAFSLRIDDRHAYALVYDGEAVRAELRIGPLRSEVGVFKLAGGQPPTLGIRASMRDAGPYFTADEPDMVELIVACDGQPVHSFGAFDGRYLSTEVAGGFTGRLLGIEATRGQAIVEYVRYQTDTVEETPC